MVNQISKIKVRAGLLENLPLLDKGELGWAVDTQQLFIGNGTITDGAPVAGNTEILSAASLNSNVVALTPVSGALVGTQNGVNQTFSISYTPYGNSLIIWNNFPLIPHVGYTVYGTNVTFTNAPASTDSLYFQCLTII
jgi:hypothetical protein